MSLENGITIVHIKDLLKKVRLVTLVSFACCVMSGCHTLESKDENLKSNCVWPVISEDEWYKFKEYPEHILVPIKDLAEVYE